VDVARKKSFILGKGKGIICSTRFHASRKNGENGLFQIGFIPP
jgi:hypothetical protein